MNNLQHKLRSLDPESFLLSTSQLTFSIDNQSSSFQIQNLSLHEQRLCVLSPNPQLFRFNQNFITLEPCVKFKVMVSLNIQTNMNLQSFKYNSYITVLCYDSDLVEGNVEWEYLDDRSIQRKDIKTNFIEPSNLIYKLSHNDPSISYLKETFLIQKISMNAHKQEIIDDECKNSIQNYCQQNLGFKGSYLRSSEYLLYQCDKGDDPLSSNQILIFSTYKRVLYRIFKPSYLLSSLPKENVQVFQQSTYDRSKMAKRDRSQSHRKLSHQITNDEQGVKNINRVQKVIPRIKRNNSMMDTTLKKLISNSDSKVQGNKEEDNSIRQFLKLLNVDTSIFSFSPKKTLKKLSKTPMIATTKEPMSQQKSQMQIVRITNIQTYHVVQHVILFSDYKVVISVSDKNVIKVFDVEMGCEVGQFKETCFKNCQILFIREWRYSEPNADENYQFTTKDPEEEKKPIYLPQSREKRFVIGSSDEMIRILSVESMKLEQTFNSRLLNPNCIEFLPDRGLFIIGGTPSNTLFGQKRKYNSLRFFRMDSLQEKPKYKISKLEEDEQIQQVIYSDNSKIILNAKIRSYARVNNTLCIVVSRQNAQGFQVDKSPRILFFFFDRMNIITQLFQLDCEMLNVRGVDHVSYLYGMGKFAIVESNNTVKSIMNIDIPISQKVVVVNLKQIQTINGLESGIEYKSSSVQEQGMRKRLQRNLSLQIVVAFNSQTIPDQMNFQLILQKLDSDQSIKHSLGSSESKLFNQISHLSVIGQCIVSVVDNTLQIIMVQDEIN